MIIVFSSGGIWCELGLKSMQREDATMAQRSMPGGKHRLAATAVAFALCLSFEQAWARMPVNPDRPYLAHTCRDAIERLKEAVKGNPLQSEAEKAATIQRAIRQIEITCLTQAPSKPDQVGPSKERQSSE